MDIFKFAEDTFWSSDYYDWKTGRVYKVVEGKTLYNKDKIPVYEDGALIGYVMANQNAK